MAIIKPNRIELDEQFIKSNGGVLKTLNYTSAKYLSVVLDKYSPKPYIDYNKEKLNQLENIVVHMNPHLDEYYAELLFRSILPDRLKCLPIIDHVRTNKDTDSYADSLWPKSVVFGILPDDRKKSEALDFFDEHRSDGTRSRYSCSQIIADEFLLENAPKSILKVLKHVNYTDSQSGSHQFNLKNIIFKMHDIQFILKWDEAQNQFVSKQLDEEWKRSIISACLTAMVYLYENNLIEDELSESRKIQMEKMAKDSLAHFLNHSLLKKQASDYFKKASGYFLYLFKVGNHKTIDGAIWKDTDGEFKDQQILIIHYLVFALQKCWGKSTSDFVMMHIWQVLMQYQISYEEVKSLILDIGTSSDIIQTNFGSIRRKMLKVNFMPEQKEGDLRNRELNVDSPLWIYEIFVDSPNYPNVFNVANSIINNTYSQKGNNGFGYVILKYLTLNSMIIAAGSTVPYSVIKTVSDKISTLEQDCWFQLIGNDGLYTPWILNRTKSHQEQAPSKLMDTDKLINFLSTC